MFTFDLKQSDLPLRPEFPVLMHQIVNWLMPQERASLSNVQVGDASVMPVSAGAVTVTSPSGETTTLQSESSSAIYTPQQVGLYTVQTEETEDAVQYFTVPFPEAETDIAPQTNLPTQQNDNGSDHTGSKATAGVAEVGNWFVLAVLLILGVEWVVFARGY